jgi:glycosyltransferase involved in cell wall biosynthesis
MKILISAGLFYPSKLGGPANTLYWLAKSLVSNNIIVSVVSSNKHIEDGLVEFNEWTEIDNIRVRYCTVNSKLSLRVIFHSIKEIFNNDVILLSSIFYIPSFFIALFASLTSRKIIWSPRGELFNSAINGSKSKLLYIKLLKLLFSKRVIFHATSTVEKNEIEKHFGSSIRTIVIPNYMELHEKMDRLENVGKYFLYVGRIAPIKALDNLLLGLAKSDAFMKSDYELLIAGGIEKQFEGYYKQLNKILSENLSLKEKVVFLGNVEGDQKFQLYADAFYSILVSHSENFGNVVIEALSQGTPVIASHGTPWQDLDKKKAGLWIDNNVDEIAENIDKVLAMDVEEYQQVRDNAYKLALEFDVYSNIDKWIKELK